MSATGARTLGSLKFQREAERSKAGAARSKEIAPQSDLDVFLPKMGFAGAVELFFMVGITDKIGGEAISKRICEQVDEHIQQGGLVLSTSYQSFEPFKRNASESMEDLLEKVATKIYGLINEDISSRMVGNGK